MDPDYLSEIMEICEEAETMLLRLEKKYQDEDYKALLRHLHSLKGTCGMLEIFTLETFFHRTESYVISHKDNITKVSEELLVIWNELYKFFETDNPDYLDSVVYTDKGQVVKDAPDPEVVKAKSDKRTQLSKAVEKKLISPKGLKAYVIDDEADFLEIMEDRLRSRGMVVSCFQKNKELQQAIVEEGIPDIVFVDNNIAGESGEEIIIGLHNKVPSLATVMITGGVGEEVMMNLLRYDAKGLLIKPFSDLELDRVLSRVAKSVAKNIYIKNTLKLFKQMDEKNLLSDPKDKKLRDKLEIVGEKFLIKDVK